MANNLHIIFIAVLFATAETTLIVLVPVVGIPFAWLISFCAFAVYMYCNVNRLLPIIRIIKEQLDATDKSSKEN